MTSHLTPVDHGSVPHKSRDSEIETGSPESGLVRQLPAVLGMRDLAIFFIFTVLFVTNVNGVQFGGPTSFLYWGLGLLTCLIPTVYVALWLVRRFPEQGGLYLWATRILGPSWGPITAFTICLPGIFNIVSTIDACLLFVQYLVPTWFVTPEQQGIGTLCVLLVATFIACIPLRWLKYMLLASMIGYLLVFLGSGLAGVSWLLRGHHAAIALNVPQQWRVNGNNLAVFGLVILALMGANAPLMLTGEVRGGKASVRRGTGVIWLAMVVSIVGYVIATFGVMVVVPPDSAGGIAANVLVLNIAFGPVVAHLAAVVLAVSQLAITINFMLLISHLVVLVARNNQMPLVLGRLNRHGIPIAGILSNTLVTALIAFLSYIAMPLLFSPLINRVALAAETYNVLQGTSAFMWILSTLQLFVLIPCLLYYRRYRRAISAVRRRLLMGMVVVGCGSCLFALWITATNSWIPTLIPNQQWMILVLGITMFSLLAGWIIGTLPHVSALLGEQRRLNDREVELRNKLQKAYNEQESLMEQQRELFAELDQLYQEQARAAVTDAITGLPNHRAVMTRIDEELARCARSQGSCAILFTDLDRFKRINDTYGHRAGDFILRSAAECLRAAIRLEDFVGRYGGEEFAILLTNVDLYEASQSAERICKAIAAQNCLWQTDDGATNIEIALTTSVGVAVYGLHGTSREELLEHADHAMYQAKLGGRNRVCIADVTEPHELNASSAGSMTSSTETITAHALTAVASAHDPDTGEHACRVEELAVAAGTMLQCSEEELHLIRLAAQLHDIGKIGIPDAILHKPGPLTAQEWVVMRRHPEIARQILLQAGGTFATLAQIVAAHHERWDGQGYPAGLTGQQIPFAARILTVVDSFDAMVSRRAYREPLSLAEACLELQRCSGSQFDPAVVDAFLQVLSAEHVPATDVVPKR